MPTDCEPANTKDAKRGQHKSSAAEEAGKKRTKTQDDIRPIVLSTSGTDETLQQVRKFFRDLKVPVRSVAVCGDPGVSYPFFCSLFAEATGKHVGASPATSMPQLLVSRGKGAAQVFIHLGPSAEREDGGGMLPQHLVQAYLLAQHLVYITDRRGAATTELVEKLGGYTNGLRRLGGHARPNSDPEPPARDPCNVEIGPSCVGGLIAAAFAGPWQQPTLHIALTGSGSAAAAGEDVDSLVRGLLGHSTAADGKDSVIAHRVGGLFRAVRGVGRPSVLDSARGVLATLKEMDELVVQSLQTGESFVHVLETACGMAGGVAKV
mmetsp:Transcript_89750/g.253082  ORF Transcript_89750/g.253082 Transcript_89750/m.253082 type:complete len:321 (-) Transcript_89750:49-1011(-)